MDILQVVEEQEREPHSVHSSMNAIRKKTCDVRSHIQIYMPFYEIQHGTAESMSPLSGANDQHRRTIAFR